VHDSGAAERAVSASVSPAPVTGLSRWVVYQRERFPVIAHGALIFAFSSGAVTYAAQLRVAHGAGLARPSGASILVAFVSCFLFFFQLRVSDEFKDFEEDSRWRPYRPVPRGLVALRELGWLALAGAAVQLALALWLSPRLVTPLLLVWGYMALMTKEFWLKRWLHEHPITVLWSHMLIMPFIDLYATTCDWLASGAGRKVIGVGLAWFLAASFFNGMVVEIGRKIRAPEDEEPGVQTYSALWGRGRAIAAWIAMIGATLLCATLAAREIGSGLLVLGILGVLALAATIAGTGFVRAPRQGTGKRIELIAGLWTIAMYLSVGVISLLF
jgi:4-hydroxybenzoate polyprenyltransferase